MIEMQHVWSSSILTLLLVNHPWSFMPTKQHFQIDVEGPPEHFFEPHVSGGHKSKQPYIQ